MGNHDAGMAMGRMAQELYERYKRWPKKKRTRESALTLLDKACMPYRGTDAEFEAEDPNRPGYIHPEFMNYTDPHPKAGLGVLMLIAFAPNGTADMPKYRSAEDVEAADELWWEEVYEPFKRRYDLW